MATHSIQAIQDSVNVKPQTHSPPIPAVISVEEEKKHMLQPLRINGLGDFRDFPDSLLLSILSVLCHGEEGEGIVALHPLLCVSKAFHQLASWDNLWRKIALNISGGDFEYMSSWRFTTKLLILRKLQLQEEDGISHETDEEDDDDDDDDDETEEDENEKKVRDEVEEDGHNYCPQFAQFQGYYSSHMYKLWYRSQIRLDHYEADTGDIDRCQRMKEKEFISRYTIPRKPVIITDIVPRWPAIEKWTPEQLVQDYGDVLLKCAQATQEGKRVKMTVRQTFSYFDRNNDYDPLYVFDSGYAERMPTLLNDYTIPNYFQQDYLSLLGPNRPNYRWLVIGCARTGTGYHVDPNGTSAWNALLYGRKRWALYPPDVMPPGVKPVLDERGQICDYDAPKASEYDVWNFSNSSSLKWYCDVYPYLEPYRRPIEIIQRAGDMVFIPAGWWHMVLNLDTTVSVTQNFVNKYNLNLSLTFFFNQGDDQLLTVLLNRMAEACSTDIYRQAKKKLAMLEGQSAIKERDHLRTVVEELKKEIADLNQKLSQYENIEIAENEDDEDDTVEREKVE